MVTLILIKPSPSDSFSSNIAFTFPMVSQIFSPTCLLLKRIGISCICTQKVAHLNSISVKLCSTIKCLSKLQGSAAMIFSISLLSSKVKRTTWSPSFCILKPFFALYKGVKFFAIASILRAHLVKNFIAKTCSISTCSSVKRRLEPSLFDSVRQLQDFVRYSIVSKLIKLKNYVSL